MRRLRALHPERTKAVNARSTARQIALGKKSVTNANWYAKNKERINAEDRDDYASNREYHSERAKSYRAKNPGKALLYVNRRRARLLGALGSHTVSEWDAKLAALENTCIDCGRHGNLTKGHMIPLSRGGSDFIDNIMPQCKPCNSRQGSKIHRFAIKREGNVV